MAVILTGATGFIGRRLLAALAARGEEVRCLARRPGPAASPAGSSFHLADFRRPDLGVADSLFEGVHSVYHLAGATRATSAAGFHESNVAVTERMLVRVERSTRGAGPRFLYISSQAAAGPTEPGRAPISEADSPAPIEAYGRSKLQAERAVLARSSRLPVTILRPAAVYGPGDKDFLSMFRLVRRGLAIYPGIRDATVTTIFVDDLVRGLIAAANAPAAVGQTYFMGHPEPATWRAIYRTAADVIGRQRLREVEVPLSLIRVGGIFGDLVGALTRRPPLLNSGKAALAGPRFWTCSSVRASRDFGFVATTSLPDGLRATYDWYALNHRL